MFFILFVQMFSYLKTISDSHNLLVKYLYLFVIKLFIFNRRIKGTNGEEMARMSDEAFENICNFMTDISYRIRTQAARLLGTFLSVSSSVLLKTLDQTLMSNLRVYIYFFTV